MRNLTAKSNVKCSEFYPKVMSISSALSMDSSVTWNQNFFVRVFLNSEIEVKRLLNSDTSLFTLKHRSEIGSFPANSWKTLHRFCIKKLPPSVFLYAIAPATVAFPTWTKFKSFYVDNLRQQEQTIQFMRAGSWSTALTKLSWASWNLWLSSRSRRAISPASISMLLHAYRITR